MNDFSEIEWLIALSRTGNTPRARDARIELSERGDEALPFLVDAVLDETLPGGAALVEIIGEIGADEASKRAQAYVFNREDFALKRYLAGGDNAANALIELLGAPHLRHLRAAVCQALSATWSALARDALIAVMTEEDPHPVACIAAKALGVLGRLDAEEALLAAAKSPHPYTRSAALIALAQTQNGAFAPLTAGLSDPDNYVRLTAIKLLSDPEGPRYDEWAIAPLRDAIADLTKDLQSSDPKIAALAAVTLAQSRSPESEEPLIEFLCFGSVPEVKRVAAVALGHVGTDDSVPELLRVLTTETNEGVQRAAAEALYRIGTYRARTALIDAKSSVNDPLRKMIMDLLKN
ncbi:hypothetical protein CCAX7_57190 [Capsulimonas corticalis]|uniref:Uncharacterized protein n=1 Tax=Capsulimonas corticalis TaxID=2219043 RepID=A0A402D0F9_9BACT|nr:HEAT repeat domain-containing protein [Capsulimonas corticalis]BDI33668.1 hypothetical protein CCAX7_57190 [Capsulimonas corticalis]